jgi:hypothetical protein
VSPLALPCELRLQLRAGSLQRENRVAYFLSTVHHIRRTALSSARRGPVKSVELHCAVLETTSLRTQIREVCPPRRVFVSSGSTCPASESNGGTDGNVMASPTVAGSHGSIVLAATASRNGPDAWDTVPTQHR